MNFQGWPDESAAKDAHPDKQVRVMQVICTTICRRGSGTSQDDPLRIVTQYWSMDGDLLAESDPCWTMVSADLAGALKELHDDTAEYARINNLGGYDNHNMRRARAALWKAGIAVSAEGLPTNATNTKVSRP